jgi:hypothetical protein
VTIADNDMTTHEAKEVITAATGAAEEAPDELIDRRAVMANVEARGVELLGPDGVLAELTKRILERGLSEELTDHVGYERGDPAGPGSGNNRNGTTPKTVLTEIGAIDLGHPASQWDLRPQRTRRPRERQGLRRSQRLRGRGICPGGPETGVIESEECHGECIFIEVR